MMNAGSCSSRYYYYNSVVMLLLFVVTITSSLIQFGLASQTQTKEEINILFVGNSYTSNDLIMYITEFFQQDELYTVGLFQRYAPNGYKLEDHLRDATSYYVGTELQTLLVTDPPPWDYVILQEQSQVGAWPYDINNSLESAIELNDLVVQINNNNNNNTDTNNIITPDTVYMMTWGRRDGDSMNPTILPNFITMNRYIENNYRRYVEETSSTNERKTIMAPVGLAYEYIYNTILDNGDDPLDFNSDFYNLYTTDGSHPSIKGIYLQACVIYMTLTNNNDPRNISYVPFQLSIDIAIALQNVAYDTINTYNNFQQSTTTTTTVSSTPFSPQTQFPTTVLPTMSPVTLLQSETETSSPSSAIEAPRGGWINFVLGSFGMLLQLIIASLPCNKR